MPSKHSRENSRRWRQRNPERFKVAVERWRIENKQRAKIVQREYRRKLRQKTLEVLGGKCKRCGFNDMRALQIDHVNGGGAVDLARSRSYTYLAHVRAHVKRGGKKYQLLCANCNWIKRSEEYEERLPD